MSPDKTSFTLRLSNAELHWLAGAMGFARLPLQLEAKPSEVPAAQSTLVQKNLVAQANGSWQVDRLPAAIVRWIGTAEWMLTGTSYLRPGGIKQLCAFTEQELGLSAEVDGNAICFTLFPDLTGLTDAVQSWINASFPDHEAASVIYELPQPETVIRTAWRDAKLAAEILKALGFDSMKIEATVEWLDSLEWAATLSRVRLGMDKSERESQITLCGDSQQAWAGSDILRPISANQARTQIKNLL